MDNYKKKTTNKYKFRELTIEKIKLQEKPDMKKYLKEFFQNPKKYFNNEFDNKQVILGKVKTVMEKYEVPVPKKFQRRLNNRSKTRKYNLNNGTLSEQISLFNDKRRVFKGTNDSTLKEGQRYINDREIENIFKSFQRVHEINKNKIKDFITTQELIDSIYIYHDDEHNKKEKKNLKNKLITEENNLKGNTRNKKRILTSKSSLFYFNNNEQDSNIVSLYDTSKINNINLKKKDSSKSCSYQYLYKDKNRLIPKIKLQNNQKVNNYDKTNNDIDNNTTLNSKNSLINKNRPKSLIKSFINTTIKLKEDKEKEKIKKVLLENEKLIEKQLQFLPNTNQKLIKDEIAKRLASQEKALMFNKTIKNKENTLMDTLSKKLKKQKSALLLRQTEDYRLIKDIKIKLNRLIKKSNPGQNYNWEYDLRNTSKDNENLPKMFNNEDYQEKNSQKDEITRDPCYKTFYSTKKKFRKQDKEYLKKKVSKKLYNKFMNDIIDLKRNYDGFLIEGQSLLKCEHDLIKKIKGKKIINNYNINLHDQETTNELYANNFDIHKFNKIK